MPNAVPSRALPIHDLSMPMWIGAEDAIVLNEDGIFREYTPTARTEAESVVNPTGIARHAQWLRFTEGFLNLDTLHWAYANMVQAAEEIIWNRILRE